MSNVTQAAMAAVGETVKSHDWRLEPLQHAERLPAEGGALRRVLQRQEIAEIMSVYEAADRAAGQAQRSYKRWSIAANRLRYAAIWLGTAALLHLAGLVSDGLSQVLAVGQYAMILAALAASAFLSRTRPFETWKEERAKAEAARAELFSQVGAAAEPHQAGELPLLPLQLEYFRRYQLDVQRDYYGRRGRQHAAGSGAADRWRILVVVLVILAAIVAAGGLVWMLASGARTGEVMQLAHSPQLRTVLLVLGILASATESYLANTALIAQDQRAAAIYLATAVNLDAIADKQLAEARAKAAAGQADGVQDFMTLVHLAMASEHQTWKQLQQTARRLRLETLRPGARATQSGPA
jgi:hypothetical protein